ncbi:hypothetical protein SARC_04700 [Sphaeroforma arctica JP610]|uniref:Uncharacterized protein n=1 Tax=Sphaeroforma arctica JP610 TaxID=667725 RepID=A0A0L0G2G8_9EUKA|nr:hypothetical protein SARC_04700 [Sphaeroforma arctica JP610]KNC83029.1 hypothetical protein SARC_04700 [Sphaeroforma arctica JP610]|eukprot:XP_014156931.1 hypothetical protein SARC_04700 [Sphaeroforma arctica JP610]
MDYLSLKPSISIADVHEFDSRLQDTGDSILKISTQEYYQYVDTPRDFDVVMLFSSTDIKYHCDLCPGQLKEYRRLATVYKSSLTRHGFKKERRPERPSPHADNHVKGGEQSDDGDEYYTEDDETEDIILDHIE